MPQKQPCRLIPEASPFVVPERIQAYFRANPAPYACAGEFAGFSESYRVWRIERGSDVVG